MMTEFEQWKGNRTPEEIADDERLMAELFPRQPWFKKLYWSIRSRVSQTINWLIDTAHRPFYRYTVPRETEALKQCLHRYCHAGTNLGTFLYHNDHYVTRGLKELWVTHPNTVDDLLKLTEPPHTYDDRLKTVVAAISAYCEIDQGDASELAGRILRALEGYS